MQMSMAQDSTTSKWNNTYKHEIGMDVSYFVDRFISFSFDTDWGQTPFSLMYRFHVNNNWSLRAKVGVNFYNSDGTSNDTIDFYNKTEYYAPSLGFEYKLNVSPRWKFYTGLDAVYIYDYYTSKSGGFSQSKYLDRTTQYGGSAFLGVRFHISPNVSLTTETSYFVGSFSRKYEMEDYYPGPPPITNKSKSRSSGMSIWYTPPVYLFLNIGF